MNKSRVSQFLITFELLNGGTSRELIQYEHALTANIEVINHAKVV